MPESNFTRSPREANRTPAEIADDQRRARMDDANASTRNRDVTVAELRALRTR